MVAWLHFGCRLRKMAKGVLVEGTRLYLIHHGQSGFQSIPEDGAPISSILLLEGCHFREHDCRTASSAVSQILCSLGVEQLTNVDSLEVDGGPHPRILLNLFVWFLYNWHPL